MTVLHPNAELFSLLAEPSWREALGAEFKTPYMVRIAEALVEAERRVEARGPELAPKRADIFRALNLVPVAKVRAVIVGQDPYPVQGDADGLAFSYRGDGRTPNALGKVLAEARREFGWRKKPSRDLTPWAEQGVLLLNVALSNLVGQTWAHGTLSWQQFTKAVLRTVADRSPPSVVLLWGGEAAELSCIFEGTQHKVLKSDRPCASRSKDDLTARPFKDSHPFSTANAFLKAAVGREINWALPPRPTRPVYSRAQNRQRSMTCRLVRSPTVR